MNCFVLALLLVSAVAAVRQAPSEKSMRGPPPVRLNLKSPQGTTPTFIQYNFYDDVGTTMMISYFTQESAPTSCQYGTTQSGPYPNNVAGTSEQWMADNGWNHHVLFSNLSLAQTYFVRCGANNDFSDEFSFRTRDAVVKNFAICVVGDMGIYYSSETIARMQTRALNDEFAFVYHIGDISYADDHVFWFQATWNTWYEMMAVVLQKVAYMVLPGNHEHESPDPFIRDYTKDFRVYNMRFKMPAPPQARHNSSMFYSFNYGPVHFVSISTETSYPNAPWDVTLFGDQMTWLANDLKFANSPAQRALRPWIVVGGHRPIYSSTELYSVDGVPIDDPFGPFNAATLQKTFERLFIQNQVDVVLNGHIHSYERLWPTAVNRATQKNYTKPSSPTYIVIGNAGNIEGLTDSGWNPLGFGGWQDPAPDWSAYRYGNGYGYATMNFTGATSMTWRFHHATDDRVLDEFTITK